MKDTKNLCLDIKFFIFSHDEIYDAIHTILKMSNWEKIQAMYINNTETVVD